MVGGAGAYKGQSEGVMTFIFLALHLTLDEKLYICGRDDVFFWSSLDFGRKTDVMTVKEPVLLLRSENVSGLLAWL